MTRDEHLQWCKNRAMAELKYDPSKPQNAVASMLSDMRKHPETEDHVGIELGAMLLVSGNLSDEREVKKWIEGFN